MSGLIPVKVGLDFVYLQVGVIFLFSPTDRNHRTSCDISNWSDQMPLSWRWITLELGMYVHTYIHININSLQWCGRKVQWHHWCFIGTLEGWLKKHVMFSAACTQDGQDAGSCVEALGYRLLTFSTAYFYIPLSFCQLSPNLLVKNMGKKKYIWSVSKVEGSVGNSLKEAGMVLYLWKHY